MYSASYEVECTSMILKDLDAINSICMSRMFCVHGSVTRNQFLYNLFAELLKFFNLFLLLVLTKCLKDIVKLV